MKILLPSIMALLLCIMMMSQSPSKTEAKVKKNEYVILLHGMGRTKYSMKTMERFLEKKGYQTKNVGYPSTGETINKIAELHVGSAVKSCEKKGAEKIHFVTHSLGGIVLRQYLQDHTLPPGSRAVMLSPPNKGSNVTDAFKDYSFYKWGTGPAGQKLGTGPESMPNSLKPIDIDVGIIIGNKSLNPFYSSFIDGENDGKVSVEQAKLKEMTDLLVVPSSHSFIMRDSLVMKQVVIFLKDGRFDHASVKE